MSLVNYLTIKNNLVVYLQSNFATLNTNALDNTVFNQDNQVVAGNADLDLKMFVKMYPSILISVNKKMEDYAMTHQTDLEFNFILTALCKENLSSYDNGILTISSNLDFLFREKIKFDNNIYDCLITQSDYGIQLECDTSNIMLSRVDSLLKVKIRSCI